MVSFVVNDFGGEVPRRNSRLLPNNMAEFATNVDLAAGPLNGLPQLEFTIDLTGTAPWPVRKAYRVPGPTPSDPTIWLPLPSEFSSVVRSPLTNDTLNRYYWTNPPGQPAAGAWWSTYAMIAAHTPPWNMGFIPVDPGIVLTVTATGGDTSVPAITRSYTFTYIDSYGQESSPAVPSAPVDGQSDGTWTVSGLPTTVPSSPPGKNYPPPVHMRLYRTITGTSTGGNFYFVVDIPFGSSTYVDTIPDTTVVNNNTLESTSWAPPLDNLDGLTAMPGGMLVGFTGNTVHFCEPDRPNAWPAGYDLSVIYPIVGFAVWQQSLVVLTQGYPAVGTGTTPATFDFSQLQAPEPCISRGSIINDLAGVYYASQNGLIMLNYFGMQNQTLSNMTKNIWLNEYQAHTIIACRHRSQYLAIIGDGSGFMIDYTEQRMGITHILPTGMVTSVWNDVYTGDAYMLANQKVYRWDSPTTPPSVFRWRSKEFYMPAPQSLGACQISCDLAISQPQPPPSMPNSPWQQNVLPPGVNVVFRLFVGPEGKNLVHEQYLYRPREIFRLPSGRKAFTWQFEIVGNVGVHSVELASTMRELKKV